MFFKKVAGGIVLFFDGVLFGGTLMLEWNGTSVDPLVHLLALIVLGVGLWVVTS